jgi:hypothetical protein
MRPRALSRSLPPAWSGCCGSMAACAALDGLKASGLWLLAQASFGATRQEA